MNRITKYLENWHITPNPEEKIAKSHAIAVHEFGDLKTPSSATRELATRAATTSRTYANKRVIAQYPADIVLREQGIEPITVGKKHELKPGAYIDTEEVNRQIARVCKEEGYTEIVLFAHPHHLWRAGENLKRHGLSPVFPNVQGVAYDKTCSRISVRSPWLFIPREILARLIYRLKRYI